MSKKIYKSPRWFVKLFNEGITEQNKLDEYLSNIVGYGKHWVKQNPQRVTEILTKEQKEIANRILDRMEAIKKYAWSRYFYENWSLVKNLAATPLSEANYDAKKEVIILLEPSAFKKAIANASEALARGLVRRKIKKIAKREK